jgi:predicted kinase
MKRFTIYAMIGPPCNGKTTLLRDKPNVISPDSFLFIDEKYVWSPERAGEAWDSAYDALYESVNRGDQYCIWDSTLCTSRARRRFMSDVRYAINDKSIKITFIACHMDIQPLEVLLERNAARINQPVPPDTIQYMHSKINMAPPTIHEGWDGIITGNLDISAMLDNIE